MKLKIAALPDDKPVKLTLELPAAIHRDLRTYAELIEPDAGQHAESQARLIIVMVKRFVESDRVFAKAKKGRAQDRPPKR
ncbi:DUF2274 domain-containing protein [Bradyrhizobium sp. HKCCYLS3077]|uniref:DUF2274 domain-containing protein n=1 Tax=Bradyrhizobium sp. HKCCYLS3077 TaxID=3420761 RepID=UPI003EBC14D2